MGFKVNNEARDNEILVVFKIFHLTRTKNHLKKSLQLWLLELFLKAVFFVSQKQLIVDFLAGINTPTHPIRRGYEICHTNFTTT